MLASAVASEHRGEWPVAVRPTAGTRPLRGHSRFLLALAWSLLAAIVAYQALLLPSYFEDDRYNLGVVERSAGVPTRHFLETSLVHLFFEHYSIPRAEDWHRGLSIVVLVAWAKLVGHGHLLWLRVPHLAWIAGWVVVLLLILRCLRPDRAAAGEEEKLLPFSEAALLLCGALFLHPWSQSLLRRSFLDDVPATVCVLLGVVALVIGDSRRLKSVAVSGGLCGLGFWMKDLVLLWLPLGVVLVGALDCGGKERRRPRLKALQMGVFTLAFCVAALPKLAWSWHDLGGPLDNPIRYWINARYFGNHPVDEHYPFFLYDDRSFRSRLALAGGALEATKKVVEGPVQHVGVALGVTGFANLWLLLPLALVRHRRIRLSPAHLRLLTVIACTWIAYVVFFGLGLGEGIQFRHWAIPVSLSLVLGVDLTLRSFAAADRPRLTRRGWWLAAMAIVLVVLAIYRPGEYADTLRFPERAPFDQRESAAIAAQLGSSDSVLLDVRAGMYYWSLQPESRVVAMPPQHLASLPVGKLERLLGTYRVSVALMPRGPALSALAAVGFREVGSVGGAALLRRGAAP